MAAYLGASSGHIRGVNLLMMDGSVKLVVSTIDSVVWKEFADLRSPEPGSDTP
jgi:prepilin-type processing-associated H-X9-DG protein